MQELPFADQDYARFRTLLRERCGLAYPEHKRADLAQGLRQTCRDSGVGDLDQLYAQLVSGGAIWDTLIMHLTIGETYFFRNQPQFMALRRSILPDLMERRGMLRHLRIWSAGCATGEEPYSIAMELSEVFRQQAGWQASLLATDINPAFLARAESAVYGAWSFRDTPDAVRDRYFQPEQSRWRLKPEISRMVRFARLNLAEPGYPSVANGTCAMDLILCRNVTIYFDEATTREVVQRLYHALTPGGWLIVGHSEPQVSVYRDFEVHNFPDTVVYRKPINSPVVFSGQSDQLPFLAQPPAGGVRTALPAAATPSAAAAAQRAPALHRNGEGTGVRSAHSSSRGVAAHPPNPPAAADLVSLVELLNQAQSEADQGNWPAAESLCERILSRDPLLVRAHYLLAQIREHQGDLDGALAAYRRTIFLDRSFVMGALGLGHVWRQKGRTGDARRCYRNALAQLSQQPATARPAGAEHISVAELIEVVKQLLHSLAE
jgi:chemotaxis protein methyltransferase CheR